MSFLRDDVRVMVAPLRTYRRLLETPPLVGWRAVCNRPATVALMIAACVTLSNAGQLLPTLWFGSALTWAWVPALQIAIAVPLILLARLVRPGPAVPLSSAIDLFFVGHAPWSLWLLGVGLLLAAGLPNGVFAGLGNVLLSGLLPIAWTCIISFAFWRTVAALPLVLALLWTLLYQGIIWAIAYLCVGAATHRLWPFLKHAGWLG